MSEVIHAERSPSGADRWVPCPGSVSICRGIPNKSSEFSQWGTAAHSLAAVCLVNGVEPSKYLEEELDGITVDDEMVDCVAEYVAIVRQFAAGNELFVEQRVGIEHITGEAGAGGTSDAIVFAPAEVSIIDLKGGRGVRVDAVNNRQLMMYAHGALNDLDLTGDIKRVHLVIVQPRLNHVSEWVISVEELNAEIEKIRQAAEQTYLEDAPRVPGEKQCRFCPAKATCPELRAHVMATVADDFVDCSEPIAAQLAGRIDAAMDNHVLANCYAAIDAIQAWCKAIEERVYEQLNAGNNVPGFKLVAGRRGNRTWRDEDEAEQALKSMRLKSDEMYTRKVISPTNVEKLLKDSPRKLARVAGLITQAEGRPTIAPATDKREAIQPIADQFDIV